MAKGDSEFAVAVTWNVRRSTVNTDEPSRIRIRGRGNGY
jgi:hypothetical protein